MIFRLTHGKDFQRLSSSRNGSPLSRLFGRTQPGEHDVAMAPRPETTAGSGTVSETVRSTLSNCPSFGTWGDPGSFARTCEFYHCNAEPENEFHLIVCNGRQWCDTRKSGPTSETAAIEFAALWTIPGLVRTWGDQT
jgi:hypothetical protein